MVRSAPFTWTSVKHVLCVVVLVAGIASPSQRAEAATSPEGAAQFIQWLGDQAISALSSPGYSLEQREAAVRGLLRQGFDLPFIGRFVLGRHWRTMAPDQQAQYQQAQYQDLFSEYILQTYSSHLGGYAGESLSITSARPAGSKDAIVRTRIVRPSGPPVEADWRVRAQGSQYLIIDVTVEGVSMAVTQRSEFASVIKNNGFEGLLAALRARTDKMPATAN